MIIRHPSKVKSREEKKFLTFYRKCEIGVFLVPELFERENTDFIWPAVVRKDSVRVLLSSERCGFRTEKFSNVLKLTGKLFQEIIVSLIFPSHSLTCYYFFTLILGEPLRCFLNNFFPTEIMHQSIPPAPSPPSPPPELAFFFALDGKFPRVGALQLANPPGWGRKKGANALSSVNSATFFIDRSVQ